MKTGILFDLDGTLLSTLEDLTDAVNEMLRHYHCPERTMEEINTFVGYGATHLIRSALPGKDTDPDVAEALAYYQAYYATHSKVKTRPYDGILEALDAISKEFPIAVVSNKPDVATKPLCRDYFGEGIFAMGQSDAFPKKPAPDMLWGAMKAIGVETCIYVGDSEVDVQTAKNAGVPCLSVLWGFRDKACLTEHGATHFCEDPKDLLRILKEMTDYGK